MTLYIVIEVLETGFALVGADISEIEALKLVDSEFCVVCPIETGVPIQPNETGLWDGCYYPELMQTLAFQPIILN